MSLAQIAAVCLLVADETLQAGKAPAGQLSDHIAAQLGVCLRERGADVGDLFAKACYDTTLWAGTFFSLKRRGVTLERAMKGVPFPELAGAVYHSDRPEPEFRRDLLLDCLSAHPGFR